MGKGQMRRVGIGIWDSRQGRERGGDLGNDVRLGFLLNILRFSLFLLLVLLLLLLSLLLLLLLLGFSLSHFFLSARKIVARCA